MRSVVPSACDAARTTEGAPTRSPSVPPTCLGRTEIARERDAGLRYVVLRSLARHKCGCTRRGGRSHCRRDAFHVAPPLPPIQAGFDARQVPHRWPDPVPRHLTFRQRPLGLGVARGLRHAGAPRSRGLRAPSDGHARGRKHQPPSGAAAIIESDAGWRSNSAPLTTSEKGKTP